MHRPAVFSNILLKIASWNLLRVASVCSLIAKLTKSGQAGQFWSRRSMNGSRQLIFYAPGSTARELQQFSGDQGITYPQMSV